MKKVRWGIIGCGDVTEVKSGPALYKTENSELVAVMRRDAAKAKDYAERHNVPKWYDDSDKLINDSDVDIVYIATPPSSHAGYTVKTAEAGKPVYVEKPMASSSEECLKMIDACRKNNVKLFVAYYRRELPYFKKIKSLLDENSIGEIKTVNIKLHLPPNKDDLNKNNLPWRVKPEIAGAGYFYDLASHQLDILDYYFGKIKTAKGISANQAGLYEAEDIAAAVFEFDNGIIGTGSWCFTMDENSKTDKSEIIGSEGKIEFSFFEKDPILLINKEGAEQFNEPFPDHVHQPLVKTIVEELTGEGKCISTGESGARTNWVMDKILNRSE